MAVAAHVSRVAKDYAPHGYSIMESSCVTAVTFDSGTEASTVTLLISDDADVYIESIVMLPLNGVATDNTNFLTIRCSSFASGGTDGQSHFATINTTTAAGIALVVDTQYTQTVLNPVLAKGRQLVATVAPDTAHATTQDIQISFYVRYRRKA